MNFAKFLRKPFLLNISGPLFLKLLLRTAVSEAFTEKSLGYSSRGEKVLARDKKLHITSIFSTRLTELKFLAWP